jgi:hypothetical protein
VCKLCNDCGVVIPEERLEILPSTKYCVECAEKYTVPRMGLMEFSHKTAPELVMLDPTNEEEVRLAFIAYKRKR